MTHGSEDIRNVCLIGPGNSGKTQLIEALLFACGAVPKCGSVDQGDTVSDFTARKRQPGHSHYSSVCHTDHKDIHINLIDSPGYCDFTGAHCQSYRQQIRLRTSLTARRESNRLPAECRTRPENNAFVA